MGRVLFICGSNIGRSQIAEAFFNSYSKRDRAWSCAGNDFSGIGMQEDIAEIMKDEFGIDMGGQKPKPFSREMVKKSDLVITLCDDSECPNIPNARHWSIPKIGKLNRGEKIEVIRLIQKKVKKLAEEWD